MIHFSPKNSLFVDAICRIASQNDDDVYFYESSNKYFCLTEIKSIWLVLRKKKYNRAHFHCVHSLTIAILNILFPKLKYSLTYWGDDYYSTILNADRLEKHCIYRSKYNKIIQRVVDEQDLIYSQSNSDHASSFKDRFLQAIKFRIAVSVGSRAEYIYAANKQYRYLRFASYLLNPRRTFRPSVRLDPMYAKNLHLQKQFNHSIDIYKILNKKELNILVCHGAQSTDNVYHSLSLLDYFSKKFKIKVNIYGYLSYSGAGEEARDAIEYSYNQRASKFANSVYFERKFLSLEDLFLSFDKLDMAFISAYRDEGVTLLTMMSHCGKLLCFNRLSMNYDVFYNRNYSGLISHEDLLSGRYFLSANANNEGIFNIDDNFNC